MDWIRNIDPAAILRSMLFLGAMVLVALGMIRMIEWVRFIF